jgi:lipopolysaccharide export system permease protein
MKTLRRYLVKEVLSSTLLVLCALLMLFLVIELANELGDAQSRLGTLKTLLIGVANIPANSYLLLPVAALLGSLFALSQLSANSEYTVMRASGASVWQIIVPLASVGICLAIVGFLIAEFAVPAAETLAQRARAYAGVGKAQSQAQRFKSGFWFREGKTFINIGNVMPDKSLADVRIFTFDAEGRLIDLTRAQSAVHLDDESWKLTNVSKMRFAPDRIITDSAPQVSWKTALTPNVMNVLQLQPDRLTASALWEYTNHLQRNNQKSNRFEAALWGKILYPLACVVLIILALPFSQVSRRAGGVGLRVFIGILLGLVFIILNRLFSFLGLLYDWPPALASLLPYAMYLALTIVMIYRVEKR